MGTIEKFAEIKTASNAKGVHAVSQGKEFCTVTSNENLGKVNVTWFMKEEQN